MSFLKYLWNEIVPSSRRTSLNFILISPWQHFCRLVADSYFKKKTKQYLSVHLIENSLVCGVVGLKSWESSIPLCLLLSYNIAYVLCFMFYVLCFMFYVLCFIFYVLPWTMTSTSVYLNYCVYHKLYLCPWFDAAVDGLRGPVLPEEALLRPPHSPADPHTRDTSQTKL